MLTVVDVDGDGTDSARLLTQALGAACVRDRPQRERSHSGGIAKNGVVPFHGVGRQYIRRLGRATPRSDGEASLALALPYDPPRVRKPLNQVVMGGAERPFYGVFMREDLFTLLLIGSPVEALPLLNRDSRQRVGCSSGRTQAPGSSRLTDRSGCSRAGGAPPGRRSVTSSWRRVAMSSTRLTP